MKILLTGAAGFIGSHVARHLLERGDTVVGVDNFNDYYDPCKKFINAIQFESFNNGTLLHLDLRSHLEIEKLMESNRFDAVVHLAAMAGVRNSVKHPSLYFDVNLTATQNLIELSRIHQVGNFVFSSTSSTYGHTLKIPFIESDASEFPLHPYAASKRAVEQIGFTYHQNYGLNFTALRLFTVYGPAGRPDMMPYLVANSIATGEPVTRFRGNFQRDWTFVDDIVNGIVSATDRPLGYEIVNLGRGEPISLDRFVSTLEFVAGAKANLQYGAPPLTEMMTTFADKSKAKNLLDFDPVYSFEEGVRLFWDWFEQNQISSVVDSRDKIKTGA